MNVARLTQYEARARPSKYMALALGGSPPAPRRNGGYGKVERGSSVMGHSSERSDHQRDEEGGLLPPLAIVADKIRQAINAKIK